MTEAERHRAIVTILGWAKRDRDIADMLRIVCRAHRRPDVGYLARYEPEAFDGLFEEIEAMVGDDSTSS